MKTMEPETKEQGAIDLSRYSKEKRQALEVTEEESETITKSLMLQKQGNSAKGH